MKQVIKLFIVAILGALLVPAMILELIILAICGITSGQLLENLKQTPLSLDAIFSYLEWAKQ